MTTNPEVDVVGVYPVDEAPEPCHLIEMIVVSDAFDIGDITQAVEDQPRSNWQVPWDEQLLDGAGERVIGEPGDMPASGTIPSDKARIAFFFHYLDTSAPLIMPWGEIELPDPSPRPDRLRMIKYEEP